MGSQKGGNYERKLCKRISLWWTQNSPKPRSDIYWRTSQSGGRATQRKKKGKKTAYSYGDMTFIDPIGQPLIDFFLFEFKKGYNALDALSILDSKQKDPLLMKFWDKAEKDRRTCERPHTILIIKRDYKKSLAVVSVSLFVELEEFHGVWEEKLLSVEGLIVVRLDDFLRWLSPETIKKMSL